MGQKLHQDASDMSELADADAQMGLFPKLQALEEEDAVSRGGNREGREGREESRQNCESGLPCMRAWRARAS